MRVTQQMLKFEAIHAMTEAEKESIELQNKIASGKEVSRPSDDPLRYVTAARFRSVINAKEQNVRNLTDSKRYLDDNAGAISRISDLLQRTRELLLRSSNETLTTSDMRLNALELRGTLEGLVQFANSSGVGGKIFGGTKTDADPFEVVRDGTNTITDVIYRGNTVDIERQVAEGTNIKLNFIGSRLFQVDADSTQSTHSQQYPGQSLGTAAFPAGDTTGFFSLQGRRVYFDTANDSLLSIAERINDKVPEINATVEGSLTGTTTVASSSAASPVSGGTFTINGTEITIAAGASLDSIVTAINAVSTDTGVTASAQAVAGGFALALVGGAEIDDTGSGASNALQGFGVTNGGSPPTNLTSRNALDYRLQITTREPDQIIANDEGSGLFLSRMGITDGTSNAPANTGAGTSSDRSLFRVLIDAIENLENGDSAAVRSSINVFDRGMANIASAGADVAADLAGLENAEIREEDFILQARDVISKNEDIDLTQAISDLRQAQLKLQTAIGASQNFPGINLLQYL